LVTIITATLNPRAKDLLKVAYTILHQTLRPIRWIIIDDGSDPPSVQLMRQVTASDHRVELMQSSSRPGDPISAGRAGKARNEAFRHVKSPYVLFANDDDPFELTYLEKAVWFLETNTGYDACGSDVMTAKEMTTGAWQQQAWDMGWTNPDDFRMMNPVVIQQIVRTSALQALAHGRRGPFPVHIKWAEE
jgi:glycosyltransferase involved in cell wall biosynthesis